MYQLTCKNHAMYVEALRAIEAIDADYLARPEEITILIDLEVNELEMLEAFGEVND